MMFDPLHLTQESNKSRLYLHIAILIIVRTVKALASQISAIVRFQHVDHQTSKAFENITIVIEKYLYGLDHDRPIKVVNIKLEHLIVYL